MFIPAFSMFVLFSPSPQTDDIRVPSFLHVRHLFHVNYDAFFFAREFIYTICEYVDSRINMNYAHIKFRVEKELNRLFILLFVSQSIFLEELRFLPKVYEKHKNRNYAV